MTEQQRLARLVEERRAMDGLPASENDRRPFDFAQWLQGVNDGRNLKDGPQAGLLL